MIKKTIALCALLLLTIPFFITKCSPTSVESLKNPTSPLAHRILDKEGRPMQPLAQLLAVIPLESLKGIPTEQITLQQLVDATQKEWLRKPGSERWQIEEKFPELRDKIMAALDDVWVFDEIAPHNKEYSYAVVFGATARSVRIRIAYLIKLIESGIHFDSVVFLGGERPLDPEQENGAVLLDYAQTVLPIRAGWQQPSELPTTETGMMKLLYDQATLPEDLKKLPVLFVDTPMQQKPDGTKVRPNTGDTIKHWLAMAPQPGSALFISHQPYVGYQDAVAFTFMPTTFELETVGPKARRETQQISVILDNLARWLYQENIRRKSA